MSFLQDIRPSVIERAGALPPTPRALHKGPDLTTALRPRDRLSIIAEVKRSSPSKGVMAENCDAAQQAALYTEAGASAISVLTEPTHFGGSLEDLSTVREATTLPILMKDFILDRRQIDTGCHAGADAFLLIASFLTPDDLGRLLVHSRAVAMDALVECRSLQEIKVAVDCGAEIIGINNRSMQSLEVDTDLSLILGEHIPRDIVAVAESGYREGSQLHQLKADFDAVLIGSALMSNSNPANALQELMACTSKSAD